MAFFVAGQYNDIKAIELRQESEGQLLIARVPRSSSNLNICMAFLKLALPPRPQELIIA